MLLFSIVSYGQEKVKAKYNYLLYLPKDYSKSEKKYPLLIYLHGGSQRGNDLNKLKVYGLPYLIDKGKNFDFIIVSPQCPENRYWTTENWFEPLYSDLMMRYRIDTDKIYCTGISIGGYGVYIVAMDFPDKFTAIVPLCGGINDSDTSRVCNICNIPIWTFHGTADDKIPINETERIVSRLRKCKGKIKFTKLQNEGHGIEYLYEIKSQIYEWLLKQKKNSI
jgi:predicted peptidase